VNSFALTALMLSVDSLVVSFALGPFVVSRARRTKMAILFGVCDALAVAAGALLGRAPGSWNHAGPALLLAYAVCVLAAGRLGSRVVERWPIFVLPVVMSLDNLAYGVSIRSSSAQVVWHATAFGLASVAMAFLGFALSARVARALVESRDRALVLLAASCVLFAM
jgi:putative Mn2+ efflux pump MntP